MKLLLDECVVRDLKKDLAEHEVSTVVEAGFGGLENGQLLRAAAGKYDVLITVDRSLPYQQNIDSLQIAVIILTSTGITYADIKPLVPKILNQLSTTQRGQMYRVSLLSIV